MRWPVSFSITPGSKPCLIRLSPRQSNSPPGDSVAAAAALNRQLRLTGSLKSSQFRPTKHSITAISPIIPTKPQGIAPGQDGELCRARGSFSCVASDSDADGVSIGVGRATSGMIDIHATSQIGDPFKPNGGRILGESRLFSQGHH